MRWTHRFGIPSTEISVDGRILCFPEEATRIMPQSEAQAADRALLTRRLYEIGLPRSLDVVTHENNSVMVSVSKGRIRIHRGYAYASDRVLSAVISFIGPNERRDRRPKAQRILLDFPVHRFVPPRRVRRRRRGRPGDRALVRRLSRMHRELNRSYFEGCLGKVGFRVSPRMRTRLGDLTLDQNDRPIEITLSLEHVERDGWSEVEHTLLHEMVHQWQAENGMSVDHGPVFRRKARELGIEPSASRTMNGKPKQQTDSLGVKR